jgi:hypothetical protein
MTRQRTVDEHIPLLVAFAERVDRLTPDAWQRLEARCAALNGPSFGALMARVRLAARPHELLTPITPHRSLPIAMIAGTQRAVTTAIFSAFELWIEFDPHSTEPPHWVGRQRTTGNPRTDACVNAYMLIESKITPLQHSQPGTVAVVRAAAQAVLRHDWLTPTDFAAVYGFVEPDIPFAELEANPGAV